jgi:hypothetical protein
MEWYTYLAYIFAGVFITNGVPHFVQGVAGNRFQSPFASPPGVGESSPLVNVIWGLINFAIGYVLIFKVGEFQFGLTRSALMVFIGATATASYLAVYFKRVRGR